MLVLVEVVVGFEVEHEIEDEKTAGEEDQCLKAADAVGSFEVNVIHGSEDTENCTEGSGRNEIKIKIKIQVQRFKPNRRTTVRFQPFD